MNLIFARIRIKENTKDVIAYDAVYSGGCFREDSRYRTIKYDDRLSKRENAIRAAKFLASELGLQPDKYQFIVNKTDDDLFVFMNTAQQRIDLSGGFAND